jgi:hypothetical protein
MWLESGRSKYIQNCCGISGRKIQQYYIHIFTSIFHDNLQYECHKHYVPPSSVSWLQLLRKQTNTGTPTTPECRNTMIYTHTNSRTLPTCDISLGWPTLPTPKAGDFVELLLLYPISVLARPMWNTRDSLSDRVIFLGWASCFSASRSVSGKSRGTKQK